MANELRMYSFALNFDGSQGITGVKNFTKALTDAKAAEDLLNASLGEGVTATISNVSSKEDMVRQARLLVDQLNRTEKQVQQLTAQYQLQAQMVGKDRDEIERLNAVARLGANATQAQKDQVLASVTAFQQARAAAEGTGGSLRNVRGVAQNLGWQLQDTVVQLQMGTSAFVVLSQQGSQFAAAFGPTGAVVGAVIAIAGALLGSLIPALKDSSKEIDTMMGKLSELSNAQKELVKLELSKNIDANSKSVAELGQRIATLNNYQRTYGKLTQGQSEDLIKLKSDYDGLTQQGDKYRKQLEQLNGGPSKTFTQNMKDMKDGLNQQIIALEKGDRAAAIYAATMKITAEGQKEGLSDAVIKQQVADMTTLINRQYDLSDAKKADRVADKQARADATAWRKEDAEFQSLAKSLVKQTNTTQEEYDRRKAIIDAHVKAVGSTDTQAAQAYIDLEVWKTSELDKELKTREAVLKQLQNAQDTQFGKTNPVGQENDLFKENQAKLHQLWLDNQLSQQTNHDQKLIDEEIRINALMEREAKRHTDKLDKIANEQKATELQTYADFTGSLGNVFNQLQQAAEDGSKEAQILFYVNRAIALAETIINTELGATKALGQMGIFGIPSSTLIRATGYASAGIIAGTTFAGAYDAGGYIPSGSSGIVSEYADELVNGTLVQGPAHVTSSDKTAQKMGTTLNVQVANQIDGATYDVQQIDEETVKIIARRELSKNIDKSVASVMSNPNSRTRKATSSSYSLKRKF